MMTNTNFHAAPLFDALTFLGWNTHFCTCFEAAHRPGAMPARVTGVHKNHFIVHDSDQELSLTVSGRLHYRNSGLYPVIGDWVLVNGHIICDILPRMNALSRHAAGSNGRQQPKTGKQQVMAANLDSVFIVSGLDRDFNIRRVERYLTLVYNCGLTPVILLTKADLHPDPEPFVRRVKQVAFGIPVHLVSAKDPGGLKDLVPYLSCGRTVTLIGSSGAGKSTLVNRLYGEEIQATRQVSDAVNKGRHTTTCRSLFRMPQGGMVIDNPGIREIGFQADGSGLDSAFPEIERFARQCRFHDCRHLHEPGCRVRQALSWSELSQDRLDSYFKMKRELAYLAGRRRKSADQLEKERWKGVSQKIRAMKKRR